MMQVVHRATPIAGVFNPEGSTPSVQTPAQFAPAMLGSRIAAQRVPADPVARQAAIENALSMALYFVRQPGDAAANLWAATARANRALTLLKQASEGARTIAQGKA